MSLKLALAQCSYSMSPKDCVSFYSKRAAAKHANMVVFPEYMATPYDLPDKDFAAAAEPLSGQFVQHICICAKTYNIYIVCSINERNPDDPSVSGGKPYNTVIVVDSHGKIQGKYRKQHLFDSYQCCESSKIAAGSDALGSPAFTPVDTPFAKLGIGICYDLRFPEVARNQCMEGAEIMLFPAAWMRGAHKVEQWHALLRARAIENTAFVVGICRSDAQYIGNSCVYNPNGVLLTQAACDDCLLIADIDTSTLPEIRKCMPVLEAAMK